MTTPTQAQIMDKLKERRDGQKEWLQDNSPFCFADQKHLQENTPERAYWHYGYMVALTDVINQYAAAQVGNEQLPPVVIKRIKLCLAYGCQYVATIERCKQAVREMMHNCDYQTMVKVVAALDKLKDETP